ncbi:MAG: Ribose import ATP-binding protein RbsA [Planctomycetes bacterium ADurb.Bin126]|nr:MAG: Ribose import ATP-binding protein RbsA [Planctomycetes bacterium ADurb.Bin126]HOD81263.1 sugar ABC transporter ATP-binding protein [Phycisphaerae bacterium]HQL71591.1 sugar ABC transporter ATP-binding protein [Phycisphaerae bacterium]
MQDIEHNPAARLVMTGVRKSFGATHALQGVDLEVCSGEVLALVGENGAGKSTLMKVLSGAHRPDAGQMRLDGEPYRPRDPLDARNRGVAMIYQELSLAPHLSVMENILLGIEPSRGPLVRWNKMRRIASAALAEVGSSEIPPDTQVRRLSIAKQQLVEIARAVATDCRVLVLDEPTSSLTQKDTLCLFDLIRRLRSRGLAIVYISHFLEEVKEISDRFTVLRDGQTVGGGTTAEATVDSIIQLMVGRKVRDLYPRSSRRPGEVVLEVKALSGGDKPRQASLSVRRGEVLGIAGLVGAGRTELLRAIFALDRVRSGQVRVGAYTGPASPSRRWAQGVGMVSENRKEEGLALGLSIAENITLPRLRGLGPGRLVLPSRQRQASRPWIEKIPIKCSSPAQSVQALSGGNQQKVAIARLLHADVDLLLLDEPTRGIDVGSKAAIYRLIDELAVGDAAQGRRPRAVVMVSSYLPELFGVCDRIAVMCRGLLSTARPVGEWDEKQLMLVATGQE